LPFSGLDFHQVFGVAYDGFVRREARELACFCHGHDAQLVPTTTDFNRDTGLDDPVLMMRSTTLNNC